MVVIIRSSPDTTDGRRGLKFARDMAADIVLVQNGVYFAQRERLDGFCGTAHVLDDDLRLRGLGQDEIEKDVMRIGYDRLVQLMAEEDKVVGMF